MTQQVVIDEVLRLRDRVATLEAALRKISAENQGTIRVGEMARAALAAATPPACDHAITLADKVTGEERCAECGAATPPAEKEGA